MLAKQQLNIIFPFALSYGPYFLVYFFGTDLDLIKYVDFKYFLDFIVIVLAFGFSQMLFKVDRKDFIVGALKLQFYTAFVLCAVLMFIYKALVLISLCALSLTLFQIERNMYLRLTLSNAFYKVFLTQNLLLLLGFLLWFCGLIHNIELSYSLVLLVSPFCSKWIRRFFMSDLGEYKITPSALRDIMEGVFSQAVCVAIPFVLNSVVSFKGIETSLNKELTLYLFFYMATFFPANMYGAKIVSFIRRNRGAVVLTNYFRRAVFVSIVLSFISLLFLFIPELDTRVSIFYMLCLGTFSRLFIPVNIANSRVLYNVLAGLLELFVLISLFLVVSLTEENIISIMITAITLSLLCSVVLVKNFKYEL